MPRTLTSAAATQAALNTGAFFHRILEIDYPSGTLWYSSEAVTFNPGSGSTTTDPRVKNWGTMTLAADPNKMGGSSQQTIELSDPDHVLQAAFDSNPGIQTVGVKIWLYFDGTSWSDAVCLFGGVISNPVTWQEATGTYRCTLKGYEILFDRNLGVTLTRDRFADVQCTEAEGTQLPICYGDPCIRVPCYPINRPGYAILTQRLGIHDTQLHIHMQALQAKFTIETTIDLIVGVQGSWERITGSFATSTSTVFDITARGAIQASGTSPGVYSEGGFSYFTINRSDLAAPNDSLAGYPLWTKHAAGGSQWREQMIDTWFQAGTAEAIALQPSDYQFQSGDSWQIGSWAGVIPLFPPGASVSEMGPWVFACNAIPSYSIVRVEAKTTVNDPIRGGSVVQYLQYSNDSSIYTYNLNDQSYNTQFGRLAGDPGLTTVTIQKPPSYFNFDDSHLYVSLQGGVDNDNPATGTLLVNPADIIKHMLTSKALGNINTAFIDTAAFSAAHTALEVAPIRMAFAIQSIMRLNDACSQLAFQAGCLYFWDSGKACITALKSQPDPADSILTVDKTKYRLKTAQTDQYDVREITTELASTFSISQSSAQVTLTRTNWAAVSEYNLRQDTINLWGFQLPTQVALATEFWLAYRLNRQRTVKFDVFLHSLKCRPGDTILVSVTDGNGGTVLSSMPCRIIQIMHQAADARRGQMEKLTVTAEYTLWAWTVAAIVPPLRDCNAPVGSGTGIVTIGGGVSGTGGVGAPGSGMPDPVGGMVYSPPPSDTRDPQTGSTPKNDVWYWAMCTSAITACSASLTNPNTFTFDVYDPDPVSGATPPPFIRTTNTALQGLTGANRGISTACASGTMIKVQYINATKYVAGEWSLFWMECKVG